MARPVAVLLVAAVVAAACSGDESTESGATSASTSSTSGAAPATSQAPASGSVTVEPGTAAPFDRVDVVGLPGDVEPAEVEVWVEHDGVDAYLPLHVDPAGTYLRVPAHPDAPMEGGPVGLRFASGSETWTSTLDIEALPESPGGWDDFVDALRTSIAASAVERGTTYEELSATPIDDVSSDLFAIKLAQVYVDDGTDTDLESLLDDPSLDDADRMLIDAMVVELDLVSLVPEIGVISGFRGVAPASRPASNAMATVGEVLRQQGSGDCIDSGITITDKADLAEKMTTARDNRIMEGGAEEAVLEGIGAVTTVGGFAPGIGAGVGAVGAGFNALQLYLNGTARLYPSRFDSLSATVEAEPFAEDTDAADAWSQVEVTASGDRWVADADALNTLLSVYSTMGSVAAGTKAAGMSDAEGFALDAFQYGRDNAAMAALADQGGFIEFCAVVAEDIDITGEPYSSGRSIPELFEVDSAAQLYKPMEAGADAPFDATLRIEANPDVFGGASIYEDYPISVAAIDIDATDTVKVNRPGAPVMVTATVSNAVDPRLEWESTKGGWRGSPTITNSSGDRLPTTTWRHEHMSASSADDYPYTITLTADTSGGLQADGSPPRIKQVRVELNDLVIEPPDGTVLVEQELGYAAFDRDGDAVAVNWQATGGTIAGAADGKTAVYTAGDEPGVYEVTATLQSDSEVTATVPVEVVEAECPTGTWRLRSAEYLAELSAFSGSSSFEYAGGDWVITYNADRTLTGTRTGWQVLIGFPEGKVTATIDGSDTGRWSVDESKTTLTHIDVATTNSVSAVIEAAGQVIPIPGDRVPVDRFGITGSGSYDCSGDVLTLQHDVTILLDRIG